MYTYIYITYVLWQHRHVIYNVYYYGTLVYEFVPYFNFKKITQEEQDDDWVNIDDDIPQT